MEDRTKRGLDRRQAMAGMAGLALGTACGPVLAQAVRGVTPTSIKVGVTLALTGPVSAVHTQLRAGQLAYAEMLNARGGVNGRKLELVFEDNEFSAQKAVTAVRKLVSRDNVFALIGSNGTAQITPVLSYLAENNVPVINSYTGVLDWFDPARPLVYGVWTPLEPAMQALGRWAAKDGHRKILVVHFDAAVARGFSQHAIAGAKSVSPDVQIDFLPIKLGTVDYVPHVLEIIQRKPDAVIGGTILQEFVAMARELRANGSKLPLYTTTYNVFDSLAALDPAAVEGTKAFTFTQSPLADTPAVKEYRDAMAQYIKPALPPDFPSLFTFAGTKIFAESLSRVKGELTVQSLLAVLDKMKDYDSGILPPVSFGPTNHQGTNALFKMVAKAGRWVGTGEMVDSVKNAW